MKTKVRRKQKKYNWTKIRNEYIQGNITYKKLSEKYDLYVQVIIDRWELFTNKKAKKI